MAGDLGQNHCPGLWVARIVRTQFVSYNRHVESDIRAYVNNQSSQTASFRLYLQTELARRCAANAQYSLRAFALHLKINHSTLSQFLRGKRALTGRTIEKLGTALGLESGQIEVFAAYEKLLAVDNNATVSRDIQQLALDSVALLSDSCHRSIIELVNVEGFIPDVRWIARVINVPIDEVNVALTRLLRLGLLEMTGQNTWLDRSGAAAGTGENHFARRVIQKLSERVRNLSGDGKTDLSGSAPKLPAFKLAVRSADLPLIVEMVKKLQKEPSKQLARGAAEDEPEYQLEISIFSKNNQTQEE